VTFLRWKQRTTAFRDNALALRTGTATATGTRIVFSPLISMLMLPLATNLLRAAKITITKATTTAVNIATPKKIVVYTDLS
jgi:hypothetical protein